MIDDSIRSDFTAGPGYLNTASVGLPPKRAMNTMRRCLTDWEEGKTDPPAFDDDVTQARSSFAQLVGTNLESVGIMGQVSAISGLVASSLPDGARVLCAEEDFTSVLFPFLSDARLHVTLVPLDQLIDSITTGTDLIAVSAVQSADGRVLDLDRLASVADSTRTRTYLDLSQAAGWLPVDAQRFDVTGSGAYKWLCSPRGTGFVTVGPSCDWLIPRLSGWYGGDEPWQSIYGPPLRLAPDARRYNLSPPWFDIATAAGAIGFLADIGVDDIHQHSVRLANRFRSNMDLEPSNSAIVAIPTERGTNLAEAGITTASRAGKVRLSFYVYNTLEDADAAAAALTQ